LQVKNGDYEMMRFILILMAALLLAACAPAQPAAPSTQISANTSIPGAGSTDLIRTDSQGAVTVTVTPLNFDKPGDTLKFDIGMSTHSVDLSMDLTTIATLKTDTGITLQPTTWEAPKGGHHIDGRLSFPAMKDGKSILDGVKKLTLTISGIDNATRIFTWDLGTK
jgi:hypothetical protein